MTYYIIDHSNGTAAVIATAYHIKTARKIIAENTALDMICKHYTDGYTITTEKVVKEYHGIGLTNGEPFTMRSAAGTKPRAEIRAAIEEYKAERERMLAENPA